jgi:hypothetical protein
MNQGPLPVTFPTIYQPRSRKKQIQPVGRGMMVNNGQFIAGMTHLAFSHSVGERKIMSHSVVEIRFSLSTSDGFQRPCAAPS